LSPAPGPPVTPTRAPRSPGGFGHPLSPIPTTAGTATIGRTGRTATTASTSAAAVGFTTMGVRKNAPYTTLPTEDLPIINHAFRPVDLQAVVDRSSLLKSRKGVNVTVEDGVVVLRGEVATERERRLAEGIVRLEPGVAEGRN